MKTSSYQQDILDGRQRLSGSDLKGKARQYGGDYARSRLAILRRWLQAGGLLLVGGRGGQDRMPVVLRQLERLEPTAFLTQVYVVNDDCPWHVWEATPPPSPAFIHVCRVCGAECPDGNNMCHPSAVVDSVRLSEENAA